MSEVMKELEILLCVCLPAKAVSEDNLKFFITVIIYIAQSIPVMSLC